MHCDYSASGSYSIGSVIFGKLWGCLYTLVITQSVLGKGRSTVDAIKRSEKRHPLNVVLGEKG